MPSARAQPWAGLRRTVRLLLRHARYGRSSFGPHPSAARTEALNRLYLGVNAWLRDLAVDYTLAYGTLLGWHREGRLLPHDRDVDFGAPVAAYDVVRAAGARLPPGFRLHDTSHHHHGPKLYVTYRGWDADIYFYAEERGMLRSLERSANPGDIAPFPREYFYPLQSAEFLGQPTQVVAQPEAWLVHLYGYIGPDAERDPATRYFRPRRPTGT